MWARLDDGFHSHPKIIRAGNAAAGLLVRVISYAGQHLTDGVVPGAIVREYGTAPQIRKLSAVGLLHTAGHECARCPQPDPGDYLVHDFLASNPSRARVHADRDRAAERQRQARAAKTAVAPDANRARSATGSRPKRTRNDADSTPRSPAAPQVNEVRHAGRLAGAHVDPTRPDPSSIPDGIEQSPLHPPQRTAAGPEAAGVPAFAQTLADQLTAAGCHVGWRTDSADREALHRHLDRIPTDRLVDAARRAWNPANPPRTIRYLLRVWDALPDTPADAPAAPLPGPFVDRHQTASDDQFARALDRARARMAAEGAAETDTQKALTA
ncbi:mucin-2 [Streptomyces sp. SCA3-4]|uniref:mucin-2 n=1 Tax=Streptomyces sichuanensis TaxID=2871810 RepID=UPI001CE269B7|nr:mucin-2 [Streptomyces sichuanensis]MCA6090965.1 mucin-2 [Streptomyces sichuanensis]